MAEMTRRREIEDAASTLFRERGYAGTSVREIARSLDIQGASLYEHVTSKHEVLWAIIDRMAGRFECAADLAEAAASPDPASRLLRLVRAHVEVVTDDPGAASVFVHEWRSLSGDRRTVIEHRRDRYEARFRSVIAEGVVGSTFATTDPTAASAFILTALNGLVSWYRPDGRLRPVEIQGLFSELALRALLGPDRDRSDVGPTER